MDSTLIESVARAVVRAHGTEELAHDLLGALRQLGPFECSYLTVVDPGRGEHEVRLVDGEGGDEVRCGARFRWSERLTTPLALADIGSEDLGALAVPGVQVGIPSTARTFVSVPVTTSDGELLGELCASSSSSCRHDEDVVLVAELLARLLADQLRRDRRPPPVLLPSSGPNRVAHAAERRAVAAEARAVAAEWRAEMAEEEASTMREALHDAVLRFHGLLAAADARARALRERLLPVHLHLHPMHHRRHDRTAAHELADRDRDSGHEPPP